MKYFKMLSLAVVAVGVLMACVGSPAASATVLCKVEPTEGSPATKGTVCPAGQAYPAGTEMRAVLAPGTVGKFTTSFKTIECKSTEGVGVTQNEGSATETVRGTGTKLTLGECNCETKVLKIGTGEAHWIADSFNAQLTSNGSEITVVCSTIFGNVHCIYVTNNSQAGIATGGNPATVDVEGVEIPRLTTSPLCSEEARWDAKYEVTSPKPLYAAAHT